MPVMHFFRHFLLLLLLLLLLFVGFLVSSFFFCHDEFVMAWFFCFIILIGWHSWQ
ncbi:MAG: hypothetical protein Q8P67_13980 [archaeon]|nr:hypothetical protein [archaeon]